MSQESIVDLLIDEVTSIAIAQPSFTVFLCGPSMRALDERPEEAPKGAELRQLLKEELGNLGFEVILGEDDGIEEIQNDHGFDAQTNELNVLKRSKALVLIAASPSSFAELGVFSHDRAHNKKSSYDVVLILSEDFEDSNSYIELGPVSVVETLGKVFFTSYSTDDCQDICKKIIRRLTHRRSLLMNEEIKSE
ncbi:hypothetical protein [Halodesulfovibrio sp. MK-HDV]|jgi:hypothetical protein|uniref:hypothetical protein n=1 Tax=Halodesulfovibrio sp. MK-HDV TaxID=2599925 RepID=UPI00136CC965|nr:hypothetical protein [Halodesulfovibrio sp. MK-HDV]KAF1073916.1 hypothetical protein MKHDV_03256 [Halodesulfovibrio sp. MK-HDV]